MRNLVLLIVWTALAGGCTNYSPARNSTLHSIPRSGAEKQFVAPIVALDDTITNTIFYVDHRQQRLGSGLVSVLFNLYNIDRKQELWVEWKATFYNDGDFRTEDTGWQTLFLPGGEVVTLKVNSISPQVKNYTVMLRTAGRPGP